MKDVVIEIGNIKYLSKVTNETNLDEVNKVFFNHFKNDSCKRVTFYPVEIFDGKLVDPSTGEIFENCEIL